MLPPEVTGPIGGGTGRPFGAPPGAAVAPGYVLEEYLVEGAASSYRPAAEVGLDGRWQVEPDAKGEYRTRLYLVRPTNPRRFSGVVLVNWQNVTTGFDLGIPPREAYEGHVWVGVTAQRVAVEGQPALEGFGGTEGLPALDPARYATLRHPGDAFSYDIFTQVAGLFAPNRTVGDVDPLGGLVTRTVLATGSSQSAMRLGSYLNMVHPREQLFDGFFLALHWGICPPPPDQPLTESFSSARDGLTHGSAQIRDDGVPVMVLCTESETPYNHAVRQPDTDSFRFWEMAGTAHAAGATVDLLTGADGVDVRLGGDADLRPNRIDWAWVADAAMRHLVAWVEQGVAPPRFPPIDVEPGPPASIRRDAHGNATGGLRVPEIEAATARHLGTNDVNPAASLLGESIPFSHAEITASYADRAAYLEVWNGAVDALAAAGLDLGRDTETLRARGRRLADELVAA